MTEEQKIIQAYNNAHMKIGFLVMDIENINKINIQIQAENKQLKEENQKLKETPGDMKND